MTMVKVVVGLLLIVAVVVVVVLAVSLSTPRPKPAMPPEHASNEVWERYYRDLAEQARQAGNDASAADYDSLARTYSTLRDTS